MAAPSSLTLTNRSMHGTLSNLNSDNDDNSTSNTVRSDGTIAFRTSINSNSPESTFLSTFDDVPRIMMMVDGVAQGSYRTITARLATTVVGTDGQGFWGQSPFRSIINSVTGVADTESVPVSGDAWVASITMTELWQELIDVSTNVQEAETVFLNPSSDPVILNTLRTTLNIASIASITVDGTTVDASTYTFTQGQRVIYIENGLTVPGTGSVVVNYNDSMLYFSDDGPQRSFFWRDAADVVFLENTFIYDEKVTVTLHYGISGGVSGRYRINSTGSNRNNSGMILGRQNHGDTTVVGLNGYPSQGCTIIDESSAIPSDNATTGVGNYGPIMFNGCSWNSSDDTNSSKFFRWYRSSSLSDDARAAARFGFWGCTINGRIGIRLGGTRSIFYQNTSSGNTDQRFISLLAAGILGENTVRDSRQVTYSFPGLTGDVDVPSFNLQDISTTIVSMFYSGTGTTGTYINWDLQQLADLTSGSSPDLIRPASGAGNNNVDQLIDFVKDYELTFTDSTGAALDTEGKIIFEDVFGLQTEATDDNMGVVPTQRLLAVRAIGNGLSSNGRRVIAGIDANDNGVTVFTPYNYAYVVRNKNLITGNTNLREAPGEISLTFPTVDNLLISETDIAVVDAYTELETAQEVYDFQWNHKQANMSLPTYDTVLFTREGDIVSTTDTVANVIFDSTATNVLDYTVDITTAVAQVSTITVSGTNTNAFAGFAVSLVDTDGTELDVNIFSVVVRTSAEWATFIADEINDADDIFVSAVAAGSVVTVTWDTAGVITGTPLANNDTSPGLTLTDDNTVAVGYDGDEGYTVKSPTTGFTGGIDAGTGNITFDAQIQGAVTCDNIFHNFVADSATSIIDTTGAIDATITLDGGAYTISNADVSALTIERSAGETDEVVISLIDTVGDPIVGDDVSIAVTLEATVVGGPTAGGNIYFFASDSKTAEFSANTAVSSGSVLLSSTDHTELAAAAVITVVFTSPGYADVVEDVTLVGGQNTLTLNTTEEGLPTVDEDDYDATFTLSYAAATDILTISVDGAGTSDQEMTTPITNYAINQVKDDAVYIRAVSDSGITGFVGSEGASSFGEGLRGHVVFTPAVNASQTFAFIRRLGDTDDNDLPMDRTVTATIESVESTVSFAMVIPTSPPAFDQGAIQGIINVQTGELETSHDELESSLKGTADLDNTQVRNGLRGSIFAAAQL